MRVALDILRSKQGVSLITVLLFMLVATIAATATWKWITSVNKSSESRMLQDQAYESAVAGIEHTRAWMTFNARETGALIQQYLYNNDGKRKKEIERTPINIDAQVHSFVASGFNSINTGLMNGLKQENHIWLMEVNTDAPTYKLKIMSQGISRNGKARHTQVAVLDVSGLYQVLKDTITSETHIPINFDFAYFGGSYNGAGDLTLTSAVVNGNWSGNPQSVTGNFIVTGNADLSGNNVSVGPLMCVGGKSVIGNQGLDAQDVFFGKHVSSLKANISGSAYFGGVVSQGNTGAIVIEGNANINDKFITSQTTSDRYVQIKGGLCMSDTGIVVSKGEKSAFQVNGAVWMPGDLNLWFGEVAGSGCVCPKTEYKCYYNECTCEAGFNYGMYYGAGPCSEGDQRQKTCEEVEYDKNCSAGDNGKWLTKDLKPANWSNQYYRLILKGGKIYGTEPCEFYVNGDGGEKKVNPNVISCSSYKLYSDKDNYALASKNLPDAVCPTGDPKDCGKFILGYNKESRVYIKSSQPSANYNSVLMAKVFNENEKPRNCKQSGSDNKDCSLEYWKDETYRPYGRAPDGPENEKGKDPDVSLYYMYFMPEGVLDVDFGPYLDNHWNGGNTYLWSYFTNSTERVKNNTFTLSYHTNNANDGHHPNYVEEAKPINDANTMNRYYRLLNHTGKEASAGTSNKITGTPYCKLATNKSWRPQCGVNSWFISNGHVSTVMSPSNKPACAEAVMNACDEYWEKKPGCDGASYLVKDPIVTAYDKFSVYASKGCAATITEYTEDLVTKLNACYSKSNSKDLYNGFLVVNVSGGTTSTDPTGKLKGKFIVIAEDPLYTKFMDTENDAYVFYYLKKGTKTLHDATRINTFIYSDSAIGSGNQFHLTGSIYLPAASCAGMGKLQSSSLTYDPNLTQLLSDACIICSNDGTPCGCTNSSTDDPHDPEDPEEIDFDKLEEITDPYFVSDAPQLVVTIETQYKSTESVPSSYDDLAPSYIVLPRITYLCKDPSGKLSDYFNVIPLNGATVTKDDANIQCDYSLNVDAPLIPYVHTEADTLKQGRYTCTAKPTNYATVPFYVWVQGSCADDPEVHFEKEHETIAKDETIDVNVYVSELKEAKRIFVKHNTVSGNWTITSPDNVCSPTDAGKYECLITDLAAGNKTLFKVTATEKMTETLRFTLQDDPGYRLTNPVSTTISMSDVVQLCRDPATDDDISSFCSANPDKCPPASFRSMWPDCPYDDSELIWVEPDWTHGFTVGAPVNNFWNIMGADATLKLKEGPQSSKCVVIIPDTEDNRKGPPIPENSGEDKYCLRASGKKMWHNVKLQFVGDIKSGKKPFVNYSAGFNEKCAYDNGSGNHSCTVPVFDGSLFSVSIEKDNSENEGFSYWKCEGSSCPTNESVGSAEFGNPGFTVDDDNTVIYIHFGEQDKHCFFDEFRQGTVVCDILKDTTQYCIDDCMTKFADNEICTGADDESAVFKRSKWHLLSGSLVDIDVNRHPSYIVAAKTAPTNTGVKVLSTVQAGPHGTLRALFQAPRAKSGVAKGSKQIKNSGFILRSNEEGDDYLMLNVYENTSGHLEARICHGDNCLDPVEFENEDGPMNISSPNLVMLSATLVGPDTLLLKAFHGDYYNGSYYGGYQPTQYEAFIKLSANNFNSHAAETYAYVGFMLADRDFKIYGIGWRSDDYNADCFDGPPMVKCSYAAVAVDGIVAVDTLTKPWVGYSGWFDNRNCSVEYWYYNGTDVQGCSADEKGTKCGTSGYTFVDGDEAGSHGYALEVNGESVDVKTAKAVMSCEADEQSIYSWLIAADTANCGPFWTGKFTKCLTDIADLLGTTYYLGSNEKNREIFLVKEENLRGDDLTIEVSNESQGEVYMEVSLISKNSEWGALDIYSRSVAITGKTATIKRSFNINDVFTNHNTTGFDPEHVIGVAFNNFSDVPVTVTNISASCENSVRFYGCTVDLNGSSWTVNVDWSGQNMQTVSSVDVTSKINDSEGPSVTRNCGSENCQKIVFSDASVYQNGNKPYEFFVTLHAPGAESGPHSCGSVTPPLSNITCSSNNVNSGDDWPNFAVTLKECPPEGCQYDVTMDGNIVVSGIKKNDGTYNYKYEGAKPTCTDNEGCSHVYRVANGSSTLCEYSFKVLKKDDTTPVTISGCPITVSDQDPSGSIVVSPTSVDGCGTGCNYDISIGSISKTSGSGYKGGSLNFSDADGSGTKSYVLTLTNPEGNSETCAISVTFASVTPVTLTCPADIANQDPAADISITPTVGGCGTAGCSYTITPATNNGSGSSYKGGTITFKNTNGDGPVEHTLTMTNPDNQSTPCKFNVTYKTITPVTLTCPDPITDQDPTADISITPTVGGCAEGCSYIITPATNGGTGSSYTSGTITFKNTEGSGKVTHTLKMTNSDNQTKPCNFDVTYKSGSGGTSLSLTNTGNNTGGPLVTGTYSITDIASCSNVRFNCEWNNTNTGCSIKVNSNAASSGGMNSSNNILSPKPQVGDVLTVNGTVTNIWCSTW